MGNTISEIKDVVERMDDTKCKECGVKEALDSTHQMAQDQLEFFYDHIRSCNNDSSLIPISHVLNHFEYIRYTSASSDSVGSSIKDALKDFSSGHVATGLADMAGSIIGKLLEASSGSRNLKATCTISADPLGGISRLDIFFLVYKFESKGLVDIAQSLVACCIVKSSAALTEVDDNTLRVLVNQCYETSAVPLRRAIYGELHHALHHRKDPVCEECQPIEAQEQPIELHFDEECQPTEVPDEECKPIEVPEEEYKPIEVPEEEYKPIEVQIPEQDQVIEIIPLEQDQPIEADPPEQDQVIEPPAPEIKIPSAKNGDILVIPAQDMDKQITVSWSESYIRKEADYVVVVAKNRTQGDEEVLVFIALERYDSAHLGSQIDGYYEVSLDNRFQYCQRNNAGDDLFVVFHDSNKRRDVSGRRLVEVTMRSIDKIGESYQSAYPLLKESITEIGDALGEGSLRDFGLQGLDQDF